MSRFNKKLYVHYTLYYYNIYDKLLKLMNGNDIDKLWHLTVTTAAAAAAVVMVLLEFFFIQ